MFIKRIAAGTYDVFVGNGWMNWSRVRKGHWGLSLVAGNKLPRGLLNQVKDRLEGR